MKRILVGLLLFSSAWALPTHSANRPTYFHDEESSFDPCDPCFLWQEALNWRIGYCGDFVFNRYLERRENVHGAGDIQTVAFSTNAGVLTVNAADWFEFYALLGATKFMIKTPSRITGQETERFFSPRLSWSIGGRGTVWKSGALALGFQGQYFRTSPKFDAFPDYGTGTMTYFNNIEKSTYQEWSASCGISYTVAGPFQTEMMPHCSAVASGAKMGFRGLTFSDNGNTYKFLNLKDKRMWGYAIGLNWLLRRAVSIGAEARFGDQKSLGLIGEVAF